MRNFTTEDFSGAGQYLIRMSSDEIFCEKENKPFRGYSDAIHLSTILYKVGYIHNNFEIGSGEQLITLTAMSDGWTQFCHYPNSNKFEQYRKEGKEIDFDSCKKIDKSFVSKKYDKTESDIIYEVKLKNKESVYIYILLEFQSTVDKFMAVRMLNYITNLYIDMISSSRKKDNKTIEMLPPVFPLLLYNGDKNWTAKTNINEL